MEKKVTKRDYYEMLKEIVLNANVEGASELVEFIDKQVGLIDAKAEKAKARNAEKKANGDELRDAVQAILTDEFQTIDAIVAQVEGEEITKAKVTARLTSLVNNGIAEKTDVKDDEGRKLKAYKLVA
jgi:superfamily I DNA/RNA helicase